MLRFISAVPVVLSFNGMSMSENSLSKTLWQLGFVVLLIAAMALLAANVKSNLADAGISVSFGFLQQQAGFAINESLIEVSSSSSYARVLLAGVVNTLFLSAACIIGASIIGILMGVLRTSGHYLGVKLALIYIELMRNTPKLLILLAMYLATINALPATRQSWSFFDTFFVSNRAIYFPTVEQSSGSQFIVVIVLLWLLSLPLLSMLSKFVQDKKGVKWPVFFPVTCIAVVAIVCSILSDAINYPVSFPELKGFDFSGGGRLSVQFLVLVCALSIYHGGQVAELVRGAIEGVPRGQFEAAKASGLKFSQMMRLVVLPQATRIIIPPLGNQYLNITKNTSIALAVGYSDLVSVMTTTINQTFRPIEMMCVSMVVYLVICLTVSWAVNSYNARVNKDA